MRRIVGVLMRRLGISRRILLFGRITVIPLVILFPDFLYSLHKLVQFPPIEPDSLAGWSNIDEDALFLHFPHP
jgi:hypothetical protein